MANFHTVEDPLSRPIGTAGIFKHNEDGFTLIEFLVALFIFLLVASGLSAMIVTTIHANLHSRNGKIATTLAQNKIEEFRNRASLAETTGYASDPSNPLNEEAESGGIFYRSWNITTSTGPKIVEIKVTWTDYISHEVTLVTMITK